jgi:hypothetical protein
VKTEVWAEQELQYCAFVIHATPPPHLPCEVWRKGRGGGVDVARGGCHAYADGKPVVRLCKKATSPRYTCSSSGI